MILRGKYLDALRACALYPKGMRREAFPSVMPLLVQLGLVEERAVRTRPAATVWAITPAGRDALAAMRLPRED